ncbi:MAG: 2-succinyl-5-enolpyruvyl-6-hydroxy-3-cyclohexene-1-carboxylic-acid synthase [Balneolaceae bacterium]
MTDRMQWAATLMQALYMHGVRQIFISPGSRSTPLTMAAALHPHLTKTVVLDERSAAFMALGAAKSTGLPAVLICTSGTAAANYTPAVHEARQSGVPMIILSADRPPALRGIGSSQTIDQIKLFGDAAVFFHEAGEPDSSPDGLRRLRFAARQAVEEAVSFGGAAHINLPFRKPLEPEPADLAAIEKQYREAGSSSVDSPFASRTVHHEAVIERLNTSQKPLLIAGSANPFQQLSNDAHSLAEKLHAPLLAECGSGCTTDGHSVSGWDLFLRDEKLAAQLEPDLIVRFGDQPYTKSLLTRLAGWRHIPTIHISARSAWQDMAMSSAVRTLLSPTDILNLETVQPVVDANWLAGWKEAEEKQTIRRQSQLDEMPELCDPHIFAHLADAIPENWITMLSNSLPVRDMATFGRSTPNQIVNRGAAGIDGIVSTALGAGIARGLPVCCITGDLAFLHDSNALLEAKQLKHPFVMVVVNNGGGSIFRLLDIMEKSGGHFTRYFETPRSVQLHHLAAAHDIPYRRIETKEELRSLDPKSFSAGPHIIECVTDPDKSMALRNRCTTPL